MAIVETRYNINFTMFTDDQIVAQIPLDPEYVEAETPRNIVWTCYKGNDEDGEVIRTSSTTIANGVSSASYTFSGLEPSTTYCITAVISNIQGVNGEIKYIGTQSTAESGGGEFGYSPEIRRFEAYQTSAGEKSITVKWSVYRLLGFNEEKDYDSEISLYLNKKFKYGYSIDGTSSIASKVITVDDYGEYAVYIKARNIGSNFDYETKSETIIVKVSEIISPDCTLNCIFEDKVYSYDNGRVVGTIHNCPTIMASDWDQFCEDINTVRSYFQLSDYIFDKASRGNPITARMFNQLYDAIDNTGVHMPMDRPSQYQKFTPDFVYGLETGLQKAQGVCYQGYYNNGDIEIPRIIYPLDLNQVLGYNLNPFVESQVGGYYYKYSLRANSVSTEVDFSSVKMKFNPEKECYPYVFITCLNSASSIAAPEFGICTKFFDNPEKFDGDWILYTKESGENADINRTNTVIFEPDETSDTYIKTYIGTKKIKLCVTLDGEYLKGQIWRNGNKIAEKSIYCGDAGVSEENLDTNMFCLGVSYCPWLPTENASNRDCYLKNVRLLNGHIYSGINYSEEEHDWFPNKEYFSFTNPTTYFSLVARPDYITYTRHCDLSETINISYE